MNCASIVRSLSFVGILASTALAQAGEGASSDRKGFVAGLSLGTGLTSPCKEADCPLNAAGSAHIGAMMTPSVAILADFNVVRAQRKVPGGSLGAVAAAVRVWPVERLWLQGGVGWSRTFDWSDWGEARDAGPRRLTGVAGAGLEILKGNVFVVDLQARSAFTSENHSFAFGIGFNWY